MSIETLRTEIVRLREENDDLRRQLNLFTKRLEQSGFNFPAEWKLGRNERKILGLLRDHKFVSYERICAYLWADTFDQIRGDNIAVTVSHMRAKLRGIVNILSVRGLGYEITAADKLFLKSVSGGSGYLIEPQPREVVLCEA
jgi:DNA-binding response OmpR family regulator